MVNNSSSVGVTRNERFEIVARSLSELVDRQLLDLVEEAPVLGAGIGGTRSLLHVHNVPVFVKQVPLTELERLPDNLMSTSNLFNLPMGCHYGVGSPSFSAWRELAANTMTTAWVREGRSACFPLMYHSRVLDSPAFAGELPDWLEPRVCDDGEVANEALAATEHNLRSGVTSMNAAGLFHFDAHFGNILADDQGLYFADFGLATSPTTEAELACATAGLDYGGSQGSTTR